MEFQKFDKIPRLSRDIVITEKIDGTNAQIYIISYKSLTMMYDTDSYIDHLKKQAICEIKNLGEEFNNFYIFAGSRSRWLDTSSKGDNFGFAKWVEANAEELLKLGEGRHYGEYMGKGIQRNYGLDEKRFALFNVGRWIKINEDKGECLAEGSKIQACPNCCDVVPVLYRGMFDTVKIASVLEELRIKGSSIVPGYLNPEGIVIYHTASGRLFKKTIYDDEKPKEQINE